jgi:hypothetical protein
MATRSALFLVVLMSARMGPADELPTLELVWLDAHRLVADFRSVSAEADSIFRDMGVDVQWEVGTDPRPAGQGHVRIQIVLMPSEPSGWGIPPNAMGVVLLPERAPQESVFLFYRPILRSAGLGRTAGTMLKPSERRDLGRAIARVVVHEVVHAVAPNLSHADEGVMHDALLVGALLRKAIKVDDRTKAEFLRGLME